MIGSPLTLACGLTLKNRIVKASMTERMAAPDGTPTPKLIRLFERFSEGGAALLLTGNVAVDGRHLEGFGNVTFDNLLDPVPMQRWATAGQAQGTPLIMQINHPGRQAMRNVTAQPVAPSAVAMPNKKYFATPRALSEPQIMHIVEQFADAAHHAERAGFAGVEVHAAHGYLLSQFLAPNVNQRTDRWGGSLANRSRLLMSVVERVRARVSRSFAVGVKLNAGDFVKGGLEPDDAAQVMAELGLRAVDFIEVSGGTFERPASFGAGLTVSAQQREGYFLQLARQARKATKVPLIVTGGLRSAQAMEAALKAGDCDLVGLARPLAVEPDLPRRLTTDPSARAVQTRLKLPRGPIAPLAELFWHREQLEAIAAGRQPRQNGSATGALVKTLLRDRVLAWQRRRYLRRNGQTMHSHVNEDST